MNQIIQQAEELRKQAISLLLQERDMIDQKLQQFGFDELEKKSRTCKKCGQAGHNSKTCTLPPSDTPEPV